MGVARDWFDALEPELRAVIHKRVLFLEREPSDAQIAELPDLVKRLDTMPGIAPEQLEPIRSAVASLAAALRAEKPPRSKRR